MDENVLEELEFHKQTVQSDENSPLHLIREKEIEISGRVLAAKRQADEIVAEARKEAAALLSAAHEEASKLAGERDEAAKSEVERMKSEIHAEAEGDVAKLESTIQGKKAAAVTWVIDSVTSV